LLNDALESEEFEILKDPKLGKRYVESEMICMVEVAAACVRHSSARRPRMGQVINEREAESFCVVLLVMYQFLNKLFLESSSSSSSHLSGC